MAQGKARTLKSFGKRIKDQDEDIKKLYSLAEQRNTVQQIASAPRGAAESGSIGPQHQFLKTAGDTMIGPIAFLPALVTIATGAIDIGKDTDNFSSRVIITPESGSTDDLVTITGAEHNGQLLFLQGIQTDTITLKTTGNIETIDGNDFDIVDDDIIILQFDVTDNKWQQITQGKQFQGSVIDSLFFIQDDIDNTRKLQFQVGGIAASTTRTWTAQNASGTVCLLDGGATQVFSDAIDLNGNDLILDADADSKFITSADDILTLNLLGSAHFVWTTTSWDISTKYQNFSEIAAPGTPASNNLRLYAKDKSGTSELFYKNDAGTERDLSAGGGSSPPFDDNQDIIQDNIDNTKKLQFSLASFAASTTSIIGSNTLTAGRTWSFPNATGVIPLLSLNQTWTATQEYNATVRSETTGSAQLGDTTHYWDDVFTETLTLRGSGGNTTGSARTIYADADFMILNMPTNDGFMFKINNIEKISITSAGALDINGNDLILDADADSKFITSADDLLTLNLAGSAQFIWTTTSWDISAKFQNMSEISKPGNPAGNNLRVYAKDVSGVTKLHTLDSSGTETSLGILSVIGDYEASVAESTHTFSFTALDMNDDSCLILEIDGSPQTGAITLGLRINGVTGSSYESDGERIDTGVESIFDLGGNNFMEILNSALTASDVTFNGTCKIFLSKGATTDVVQVSSDIAGDEGFQHTRSKLTTDQTSISSVTLRTTSGNWNIGTRATLYKVARA